ncbi:MAG TPA: sterol desaturase family protein [Burkholderiaceae bacterium]|nr:sterol desaturase family protein [Burkholderiaceae bacterium]
MNSPDLTAVWLAILTADFLRYTITAAAAYLLLWKMFGAQLQRRRILDDAPKAGQIRREVAYSMVTVLIFAGNGFGISLLKQAGCTRIYDDIAAFGALYRVLSLLLAIVAHDAYFYWTHRLLHRPAWFRHVHRVHHQSISPTPWAAYSFHPLEAVVQAAFLPLFVLLVPIHPAAIGVFVLHMIVRNCLGHSGFEVMPWRQAMRGWLRWTTTVSHHHFHHARGGGNFGLYFTWWDRFCGTEDARYRANGDARFDPPMPTPQLAREQQ